MEARKFSYICSTRQIPVLGAGEGGPGKAQLNQVGIRRSNKLELLGGTRSYDTRREGLGDRDGAEPFNVGATRHVNSPADRSGTGSVARERQSMRSA